MSIGTSREFKQGVYKPINPQKYIGKRYPFYRSSWERQLFWFLDKNENVTQWNSEATIIPYVSPVDGKWHRYYTDATIALREGDKIVRYIVEVKPSKQIAPPTTHGNKKKSTLIYEKITYAVNQAKWKAAEEYAKKSLCKFIILTEKELGNIL